jgi:hypothetical protein
MPTATGLPKPGEIWRLTRKLPPDWQPIVLEVEILERSRGDYWSVRVRHLDTGQSALWVDVSADFAGLNGASFEFVRRAR